MARASRFDVVGLGEVMLTLSVPAGERIGAYFIEYAGAAAQVPARSAGRRRETSMPAIFTPAAIITAAP